MVGQSSHCCSVHPREPAVIQCCDCVRLGCEEQSYHCSSSCYQINWSIHKALHEKATRARQAAITTPVKVTFTTPTPTKSRKITIQASSPVVGVTA